MNVKMEEVKNKERFNVEMLDKKYIDEAIEKVIKKVDLMMERFGEDKFPWCASKNGKFELIENVEWTTSFWTGMLWLAYEHTRDEKYKKLAQHHTESFRKRIDRKGIDVQHHDLGFLYTLSCVADYELTGSEFAKETAVEAADFLITRFSEKAKVIQAWGQLEDPEQQGRMIIDCNLNLPLLYWSSLVTKNDNYKRIAYEHVKSAQKYIIREDASTFHTFYMDTKTGEPRFGKTAQGYSDDSCWSRGQAWGIYGFMLSYNYTGDATLLETSKKLLHYFLNRLPEDHMSYWDLIFTEGDQPRDTSASIIAVCGMLELLKYLPLTDTDRNTYEKAIFSIIKSANEKYVSTNMEEDGVLLKSTYGVPQNSGIEEFCSWGDYYYFEALIRLAKAWKLYW